MPTTSDPTSTAEQASKDDIQAAVTAALAERDVAEQKRRKSVSPKNLLIGLVTGIVLIYLAFVLVFAKTDHDRAKSDAKNYAECVTSGEHTDEYCNDRY